jgi:hypothetical protein
LIIHRLVLILKISTDSFPFELYHIETYDRYRRENEAFSFFFNLIGSSPPLKELGFSGDLAEKLSSVSYESYRRCMEKYEVQKEEDRIRRRANHDVESVLEEIERMNRAVSGESEV